MCVYLLLLRHIAVQWWHSHDALCSPVPSYQDGIWWAGHGSQVILRNDFISAEMSVLFCVCCVFSYFCFTFNTVLQRSIASLQAVATEQEWFRFCESWRRLSSVTSFSQHVLSLVDAAHSATEEQWELHPLPLRSEILQTWEGWGSGCKSYLTFIWSH